MAIARGFSREGDCLQNHERTEGFCCCLHPLPLPNRLSLSLSLHQESLTYLEKAVCAGLIRVSFHHYGSLSRKLIHAIAGKP